MKTNRSKLRKLTGLLILCFFAALAGCTAKTTAQTRVATTAPTTPRVAATIPTLADSPDTYLPRFGSFDSLEVVDTSESGTALENEVTPLVTLEGLVNRTKPRLYIEQAQMPMMAESEGAGFWLSTFKGVAITRDSDNYSAFNTFRGEINGVIIYDPYEPDSINLATSLAGVEGGVVASPEVAATLEGAPYSLPVLEDLRKYAFRTRAAVYQYALDHVWSRTTHRLIISLDPAISGGLRDYAVAAKAMVIFLDPRKPEERPLLDRFLNDMPAGAPYLGNYPDPFNGGEQVHVTYLSDHEKPAFVSDYFNNATVLAGTPHAITVPPIPAMPALENKVYVTFIISDGDNMQYTEHQMVHSWADPFRGKVPLGWTVNPGLVDFAPQLLNYFWSTATANDVLVAGPSGMGYTYPDYWPNPADLRQYTETSYRYMKTAGLRVVTFWDDQGNGPNSAAAAAYTAGMPGLLGITYQNGDGLSILNQTFPQTGLHPIYGDNADIIKTAIWLDSGLSGPGGQGSLSSPYFVAVQANAWNLTPELLYNVMTQLQAQNPNFAFVRPDHFFMLARKANGLKAEPEQ